MSRRTSPRTPTTTGYGITLFLLVPAQDYVGQFLAMLKDYPPRQKAARFNLDKVMRTITEPIGH
jgi:hypothetical protein